jgi:hypothetical protein
VWTLLVATLGGPVTSKPNWLVNPTCTVDRLDGPATLVAINTTVPGAGRICGAVKTPAELTKPQVIPEQPSPLTVHITAELGWPADVTLASNTCSAPSSTAEPDGEISTVKSLVIVTIALPTLVPSATLDAWSVTVAGLGSICGAVNIPFAEIVPIVEFPDGTSFTLQLTPGAAVFEALATNVTDAPRNTDAVAGLMFTAIGSEAELAGCDAAFSGTVAIPVHPAPNAASINRVANLSATTHCLARRPDGTHAACSSFRYTCGL